MPAYKMPESRITPKTSMPALLGDFSSFDSTRAVPQHACFAGGLLKLRLYARGCRSRHNALHALTLDERRRIQHGWPASDYRKVTVGLRTARRDEQGHRQPPWHLRPVGGRAPPQRVAVMVGAERIEEARGSPLP